MLLRSESMNGVYQVVFLDISRQSSPPLRANVDVTLLSNPPESRLSGGEREQYFEAN